MHKYSFVLPAYKARFFREALDSILAQTYTDFELIIVNDASPEDLDSIVKSYDDPRIRYYVNEENIGGKDLVAQWNHCLEYAQGEYVILASDDDVYFPQYLEKMDVLVQKYPEVNVFRPRVQTIDKQGNVLLTSGSCAEKISAIEYLYLLRTFVIGSGMAFYIFRKKELSHIGGFVNFSFAWGADEATVMKMAYSGMGVHKDILFSFRQSGENISSKYDYQTFVGKLRAYISLYDFERNYLATLLAKTAIDEQKLLFLKNNLSYYIKGYVAEMIHKISFYSFVRAIPVLWTVPTITLSYIAKRTIVKFYRLFF